MKTKVETEAKTTIKVNGQNYDARTGQPLDRPANIDGVMISHSQPKTSAKKSTASHHVVRPAPSHTLMRKAVSKPAKSERKIQGVSLPLGALSRSSLIQSPVMATQVDPELWKRAKNFRPSKQISRFGAALRSAIPEMPAGVNAKPEIERIKAIAKPAGASLLERAVDNAKSHEQPRLTKKELQAAHGKHHNPRRGHRAAYTTVGLMALMVIAYAVYVNIPNVMVKIASVRAGFSAVLPGYRPPGFSLASVSYQAGTINFNFSSNSDQRHFTLTEHSTNWDSATLVSSVIVPTQGSDFQRLSLDGQNIYLFGNDQAAWVNNGIWYQATGNGSLSTNQMIKLATTV